MTKTPTSMIAEEPAAVAGAAASAETAARPGVVRGEIERELATDPWHLVRRACQIADYEFGAPASPETDGR